MRSFPTLLPQKSITDFRISKVRYECFEGAPSMFICSTLVTILSEKLNQRAVWIHSSDECRRFMDNGFCHVEFRILNSRRLNE